jgi:phosphate-selective porin OprO/OprP
MNQNLITVLVRFLMRFGVFILVTTPLTSLHAQNSAQAQDQSVQDQLEALRKEIANLKAAQGSAVREGAAPRIQQQGAGQNIGGTTEQESIGDDTNFDVGSRLSVVERNQEIAAEEAAKKAAESPRISFTDKGFTLRSADNQHALRLGGTLQLDDRQYVNQANDANNQFIVRRARVYASGTLWKYVDFRFMPDFGLVDAQNLRNTAIIADAWLNFKAIPEAQVQVGKYKPPLGLEMLQSDQNTVFMERSATTQLQPSRALGVQVHGLLFDDELSYAVGVFSESPNNYTQTVDTTLGYGIAARLFARPFVNDADALSGLGFGVAGSYANDFDPSSAGNSAISNGLNSYASDTGVTFFNWQSGTGSPTRDGAIYRIIPQAFYYYGPFGIQAEYILQSQGVELVGAGTTNPQIRDTSWAWQTTLSYNLTGEDNGFDSLTPKNNFDFFQTDDPDAVGLWQIAFRADQIQLDEDLFQRLPGSSTTTTLANGNTGNNARTNARGFNSYSLGFNWYLNPSIRASANAVYTQWYYSANGGTSGIGVPSNNSNITNNEFGITTRLQLFF